MEIQAVAYEKLFLKLNIRYQKVSASELGMQEIRWEY